MEFKETIGIDVSKNTIDVSIHTIKEHRQFKNDKQGFVKMTHWVSAKRSLSKDEMLYAFEHTGLYSLPLSVFLTENKYLYTLIPGLELSRSLGISRGKDDKVDSQFIALYAYRRREEISPYQLPSTQILHLRRLLSLRERLVKQRSGFKATLGEIRRTLSQKENALYFQVHESMILSLSGQIRQVEGELRQIIKQDEGLNNMYKLITSIKGVGEQTTLYMIAYTNGFTLFANARKFASYAGIAPFPHQSGVSIRGKTKVHSFANKKFKSLLNNCATTAILYNTEMRQYFRKRIVQGKNKMSTTNVIRNKILGRIFAVVKRNTPYVDTLAYAAL